MNKVARFLTRNSSSIFTGMSITCTIASVILAVNTTPKAMKIISKKQREKDDKLNTVNYANNETMAVMSNSSLTKKEIVKAVWKCYIPTGLALAGSIGFAIASNKAGLRRSAALASLLTASEQALVSVTEKSIEKIGEKKTKEIEANVMQEKIQKNLKDEDIIFTGEGETLFWDDMCSRPFKHDIEKVRARINDLNEEILDSMWLSLNDLYYALGLPASTAGSVIGWNINGKGKIRYEFIAIKDRKDRPCLSLVLHDWETDYNLYK